MSNYFNQSSTHSHSQSTSVQIDFQVTPECLIIVIAHENQFENMLDGKIDEENVGFENEYFFDNRKYFIDNYGKYLYPSLIKDIKEFIGEPEH
jgi:hypothetical protein